jgi:hypothetical protein
MEARMKGREGKGSRNDVEFLRTGLLRKDLKELKWVSCSWVGEGGMGRDTDVLTGDQKAPLQLWCCPGLVLEKNPRRRADRTKSHSEWRAVPWRCVKSSSWEVGDQAWVHLGGVIYTTEIRDPQVYVIKGTVQDWMGDTLDVISKTWTYKT